MEEKQENNEPKEYAQCNCNKSNQTENLIKFAILLLTLFLAIYIAVYYVLDQIRHSYYIPQARLESIDKILKEQDKLFESMGALPMHNSVTKELNNPIEIYKNEAENAYKIILNLKDFDNNPENIKLDIMDDKIIIRGNVETNKKNLEKRYEFTQTIVFPEKIEKDKIKKETKKNKYIITLPIDD